MYGGIDPGLPGSDHAVVIVREYTRDAFRIRLFNPPTSVVDPRHLFRAFGYDLHERALPSAGKAAKHRLIERLQRKLARGKVRTQWERRPAGHRGVWWRE